MPEAFLQEAFMPEAFVLGGLFVGWPVVGHKNQVNISSHVDGI